MTLVSMGEERIGIFLSTALTPTPLRHAMYTTQPILNRLTATLKTAATLAALTVAVSLSGCDQVGPQTGSPEGPSSEDALSNDELETRVQEALGSQVTELQVREINVSEVASELERGETTIPYVTPENEVVEMTYESRPANLRPDSVDTGVLREGPETSEQVPLPPEQSYLLGEPDNASRLGGLTILDDDRTMLRGLTRHSDYGISYIQSVNQVLQTDDYPNRHVIYNIENTGDLDIGDGEAYSSTDGNDLEQGGHAKLNVDRSTSVVLDGDVQFYQKDPNTVWRRQESLFLAVQVTDGIIEPITSDTWRLDLSIAGQEVWVSGGPSTKNHGKLMRRLEDPNYYLIHPLSQKQMHLFLVGYDVNGLAGRAGGIGDTNGGWGGGSGDNHLLSETIFSLHMNRIILTHEVGHLIGGHHGHSIRGSCSGSKCGRSIMTPTVTPGNDYFFSDQNDEEISAVIQSALP